MPEISQIQILKIGIENATMLIKKFNTAEKYRFYNRLDLICKGYFKQYEITLIDRYSFERVLKGAKTYQVLFEGL